MIEGRGSSVKGGKGLSLKGKLHKGKEVAGDFIRSYQKEYKLSDNDAQRLQKFRKELRDMKPMKKYGKELSKKTKLNPTRGTSLNEKYLKRTGNEQIMKDINSDMTPTTKKRFRAR